MSSVAPCPHLMSCVAYYPLISCAVSPNRFRCAFPSSYLLRYAFLSSYLLRCALFSFDVLRCALSSFDLLRCALSSFDLLRCVLPSYFLRCAFPSYLLRCALSWFELLRCVLPSSCVALRLTLLLCVACCPPLLVLRCVLPSSCVALRPTLLFLRCVAHYPPLLALRVTLFLRCVESYPRLALRLTLVASLPRLLSCVSPFVFLLRLLSIDRWLFPCFFPYFLFPLSFVSPISFISPFLSSPISFSYLRSSPPLSPYPKPSGRLYSPARWNFPLRWCNAQECMGRPMSVYTFAWPSLASSAVSSLSGPGGSPWSRAFII